MERKKRDNDMAVRSSDVIRRAPQWGLAFALTVLAAFAVHFIVKNVFHYAYYDSSTYGDLWPRRHGLLPHIAGGVIAILVGLTQLWLGATGRTALLHRTLGRIYAGAVVVASAGAFYLALTLEPKYFTYAAGLFGLGLAWVVTTSMAVLAIHRRSIEQHREWMIRSYIVTFGFVTFRLFDNLLIAWKVAPASDVDSFMAFACWSIPLLLAEPLIQLRKIHRR
jgi:uncharacterized membrane protein